MGEYCVAGIDCISGKWVRLISDCEETHGAIDDDTLYDSHKGRYADVLDRVCVEIVRECPGRVQTENVLVAGKGCMHILERMTLEQVLTLHPYEPRKALFQSHHHIVQVDIETLSHSLEFVCAENVYIYTVIGVSGKPKYKIDFECNGQKYTQFAMTDPMYYLSKTSYISRAALVLSISDDEWSWANGHYIYVAKVFDISPKKKFYRTSGIWKWSMIIVLLCGLIGAGSWLFQAPRVYIPPYSGAKYHIEGTCHRLNNPTAAHCLPLVLVQWFYKPCEECSLNGQN